MPRALRAKTLVVLATLAALWPVWSWYFSRVNNGSDEPWGVLALVTALALLLKERRLVPRAHLGPALAVLGVYVLSFHWVPPMVRAALGITTLALVLCPILLGRRLHLGIWALLLLSLPITPSLEFYLGYPLRTCVAHLAAPLLQLGGLFVTAQGSNLMVGAQTVSVDAPCAGIAMLWVGSYLFLTLSCVFRLPTRTTASLGLVSVLAIIFANVLRASALFYAETGLVTLPPWGHAAVGATSFFLVVIAIVLFVLRSEKDTWNRLVHI